jgi:hypothetical protein
MGYLAGILDLSNNSILPYNLKPCVHNDMPTGIGVSFI